MSWVALRVHPSSASANDAVLAALFAQGSQGVQEEEQAVLTQFEHPSQLESARRAVLVADPHAQLESWTLPDTDWSREWRRGVTAHEVGTLVIAPPWLADLFAPERRIVIEPGMAFGTGEHPTTRGVVRLLECAVRPGDRVADLGAGSAVLSIAAVRLGASRVAAIELDADAIGNAEENVAHNGVAQYVHVIEGDAGVLLPLVAPVRLVIANIISSVLAELLPVIAASLDRDGEAILSGILLEEREEMIGRLHASGWRMIAEDVEEQWWSVRISRS